MRIKGTTNVAIIYSLNPYFDDGVTCEEMMQHYCLPKRYSTSIEAAWQVVEKMRDVESFDLGWVTGTKQFRCFILLESPPNCKTEEEVRALDLQRYGWHYAEADTAPLAICLAALKAVGVNVSSETA